jgi:hypothetical protein
MTKGLWTALARWLMITFFIVGSGLRLITFGLGPNPEVLLPILAYTVVGGIVTAHRPQNPVGWVFLGVGGLTGLGGLAEVLAHVGIGATDTPWWSVGGAWVTSWYWYPLLGLMTTFTVLLYPSGLPSRRWRPVLWLAIVSTMALVLMTALQPYLCLADTAGHGCRTDLTIANPWSPGFMSNVTDVESTWFFSLIGLVGLLCGLAAVISAVVRTRRATGVERLQMRWFSFAVSAFAVDLFLASRLPGGDDGLLATLAFALALTFVPVSCGIAIMRYRLYEIDRIVSRTTTYALVTGVLIAVYVALVTAVGWLLPDSSSNALAVAAATLAAAALFRPLLSRVQAAVDRRFNRARYDAEHSVQEFADRLRNEVDPDLVLTDLVTVLRHTVQPTEVSFWLRTDPR